MRPMHCAIVGGNGAVGRLFAGVLHESGAKVTAVDRDAAPHPGLPASAAYACTDATAGSLQLSRALAGANAVVLAVPEAVALDALPHVLACLRPGALVADTLSVKSPYVAAAIGPAAAAGVELLSLNPMFAPDLGLAGRTVLAVEVAGGPRSDALLAVLRSHGGSVVALGDAAAHDRLTAALQVAPHAALIGLGLALEHLGGDLDTLLAAAPPPLQALLALVARVASGAPETYADIQRANPFAAEARAALAGGLAWLDEAAGAEDAAELHALLGRVGGMLGDERERLAARSTGLFHALTLMR